MKVKFSDLTYFNNLVKDDINNKISKLISKSEFIGGHEKINFEKSLAII